MKAAIRLEISKKDEAALLAKANNYANNIGGPDEGTTRQGLITFYRTQLHAMFKLGLASPRLDEINEEPLCTQK